MDGYDRILEELKNRAIGKPELVETASLYIDLISAQARVDVSRCESTALADEIAARLSQASEPTAWGRALKVLAEAAAARLSQGQPILLPERFQVDCGALARLCDRICIITAQHRPERAEALNAIRIWLESQRESIGLLAVQYLRDEGEVRQGEEVGLDSPLLAYLFNHALHPFLRKYARILAPFVDESIWYRPYCPICRGEPDFAALEKATGARRLLCSRCDFEWAFWRASCPFCGCDDPDRQKDSAKGQVYRFCLCEQCGRYLKTIDLRQVEDERLLPVERILTLAMDLAAQGAGRFGVPAAAPPA